MSDYYPNPTAVLSREGVDITAAVVQTVDWEIDEGWSWSATLQGDDIDPYEDITTAYQIDFTDGLENSQSTPTLVLAQHGYSDPYDQSDPDVTTIGGTCAAMFNMRRSNQNFPSFISSTAALIIADLGTRAGVTISGAPADFDVLEEDVKQAKLADALSRFLDVAAYEFAVTSSGTIACQPWEQSAGNLVFDWSAQSGSVDKRNLFSGIRLGKRSSMPFTGDQVYPFDSTGIKTQSLATPITGPMAVTESMSGDGYLLWACFFNEDDEYVSYQDFTFGDYPEGDLIVPSGTGAATYFTCQVAVSVPGQVRCVVRVTGTPEGEIPAGVDQEFLWPAVTTSGPDGGDDSLGDWPYESDFIDQLFPSQAYAEDRYTYILSRLNADADTVTLTGPLQCGTGVQLFLRHTFRSRIYKVKKISWNFANNETTINLVRLVTEALDV